MNCEHLKGRKENVGGDTKFYESFVKLNFNAGQQTIYLGLFCPLFMCEFVLVVMSSYHRTNLTNKSAKQRCIRTMEIKDNRFDLNVQDKPLSVMVKCMMENEKPIKAFIRKSLEQDSDVEDIFQLLMEKTLKMDTSFVVEQPLSYGYKIAQNLIIDFARQQQRNPEELTFEPESDSVSLEEQLAYEQRIQIYQRCVANMPPLRRQVFIQRRLHGKSRAQISAELGLNDEAVKKHISRAMSDLENEIRHYLSTTTTVCRPTLALVQDNSEKFA